ncbi:MAG: PDZ domain-containing protein [Chitinophagaceae bacterium]
MKKILLLGVAFSSVFTATAQNAKTIEKNQKESIIVESPDGQSSTRIEIRNGEVWINGEKVDQDKQGSGNTFFKKKIIINGKDVTDDPNTPFFDMDAETGNKAMLGVNTKAGEKNDGAVVESVVPRSPAEKFGLKAGDVITRVGDKNIYNPNDLVDAIAAHKPGEKVDITFERDSKFLTKNVELSERNGALSFRGTFPLEPENWFKGFEDMFRNNPFNAEFDRPSSVQSPKIGVEVEDRADGNGVYVLGVTAGSQAEKAGIQVGDVIQRCGDRDIQSVDALSDAINRQRDKELLDMHIERKGKKQTLSVKIPKTLKKKEL